MIGNIFSNGWKIPHDFSNDWKNFSPVFQRLEKIFAEVIFVTKNTKNAGSGQENPRTSRMPLRGLDRLGRGKAINIGNHENRFADIEKERGKRMSSWSAYAPPASLPLPARRTAPHSTPPAHHPQRRGKMPHPRKRRRTF
jgi:hypothetical protein